MCNVELYVTVIYRVYSTYHCTNTHTRGGISLLKYCMEWIGLTNNTKAISVEEGMHFLSCIYYSLKYRRQRHISTNAIEVHTTVRCRYNVVNFLPNPHNRPPWPEEVYTLIYILRQSMQWWVKYHVITVADCTYTATNCPQQQTIHARSNVQQNSFQLKHFHGRLTLGFCQLKYQGNGYLNTTISRKSNFW